MIGKEDINTNRFTLVINAGGDSRRMGQSKALLPVPTVGGTGSRPLIAHIAERLRPLSPERLVVVANDPALVEQAQIAEPVEFIPDAYPGMGVLGGIATALEAVDEWAILVACDMPLVDARIFERMCGLVTSTAFSAGEGECVRERVRDRDATAPGMADRVDVIVPMVDGYAQTLHAIYHRRCLPAIGAQLAADERKITRFFPNVRVHEVTEDEIRPLDPEFRSFMNVNRPEEWAQALRFLG